MSDEELSLRHRRASEAAAGAPSAAAREAIRREAEAQAAARRTAPELPAAANDSYWPMRAVATLAVVAIAAGLWWQMRPQPTVPTAAVPTEAAPVEQVAQTARVKLEAVSPQRPDMPPPPPAALPAAVAVSADVAPNPLAAEIARRFPDAWNSTTPVDGLWVRVDANGRVVEGGQRASEQPVAELKASDRSLAREAAAPAASARVVAAPAANAQVAGDSVVMRNAHGVPLRISILRDATRP